MYFFLSKVLLVFITPLFWVFALLIWSVLTRKAKLKQRLLIIGCITLYLFSVKVCADLFASIWDVSRYKDNGQRYTAIILLGGFVGEDSEGNGFFNGAADRFTQAVKLYRQQKAGRILFTGGNADLHPDKFTEADYVKTELKRIGIPDSLVMLDYKARNTKENAVNAKRLLDSAGLKPPYLLVTSAFHMRRARAVFKKAGISVTCYPADFKITKELMPADFLPSVDGIGQWQTYLKEVIGYITT